VTLTAILRTPHTQPADAQSDNAGGLSWNAFRGSWRQDVGDVQAGVTLDRSKHSDFFHTAAVAKRVLDSDTKVDAQVLHDFADQSTKVLASVLTKDGTRISGDVDRNLKLGRIELSKTLSDLPLSRQLGERLTVSPSVDVDTREVHLEVQQDVGKRNAVVPSVHLNRDGSVQRWGLGWMSRLENGDAVCAQIDPQDQKLDVRYDKACDDGSHWRISASVPATSADDVLSNTHWSITRAWNK